MSSVPPVWECSGTTPPRTMTIRAAEMPSPFKPGNVVTMAEPREILKDFSVGRCAFSSLESTEFADEDDDESREDAHSPPGPPRQARGRDGLPLLHLLVVAVRPGGVRNGAAGSARSSCGRWPPGTRGTGPGLAWRCPSSRAVQS